MQYYLKQTKNNIISINKYFGSKIIILLTDVLFFCDGVIILL